MSGTGWRLRRAIRWGAEALGLGAALGFALGSFGLVPVADVHVRWTVPALEVGDYVPGASSVPGGETVLIYIGSSTCGWSNTPELPSLVRRLKSELQARAHQQDRQFAAVGIAKDRRAADGLVHLEKFGAFDEVMAGHGCVNRGIQEFVCGEGDMAGYGVTPQIIVVSRRLEYVADGHISIADERTVTRKAGLAQIREWIALASGHDRINVPCEHDECRGRFVQGCHDAGDRKTNCNLHAFGCGTIPCGTTFATLAKSEDPLGSELWMAFGPVAVVPLTEYLRDDDYPHRVQALGTLARMAREWDVRRLDRAARNEMLAVAAQHTTRPLDHVEPNQRVATLLRGIDLAAALDTRFLKAAVRHPPHPRRAVRRDRLHSRGRMSVDGDSSDTFDSPSAPGTGLRQSAP